MIHFVLHDKNDSVAVVVVERLARQRGILVMDDPEGRLVLTQLAAERATDRLIHPADGLLKIATKRDSSKRFSDYKVKAQAGGRWASFAEGDVPSALAHVEGGFRDTGVTRYRPKTILNEGAANKEGALARAEHQARRNIGRGLQARATRVGWRQRDGALWRPNILVRCSLPAMNLDAELALGEVSYRKSASGATCDLDLMPPEAFTPDPPEEPAGTGGGAGLRWSGFAKAAHGGEG